MADDAQPSDNDRLISVLKSCFVELIQKQEDIQKAVEALKPQVAMDKKTTFWTTYMKLADEHDKELHQKYSTDLDTTLIFAGLFSAVSSAFIIQIQPQAGPDAPTIFVAAQSLLYISLLTTLLAALLAILGKQWLMYYQAAGSRGTIEERGLERQRKLDGLRRWKFDAVLQMLPLLLQLALLLFSSALSLYLWTLHRSIAAIVLGLTLLGLGSYIALLATAIASPDSPFQTPFVPPARQAIASVLQALAVIRRRWRRLAKRLAASLARVINPKAHNTLPSFVTIPARFNQLATRKPLLGRSSAEVPAVVWILETSTDPMMISAAAEMAVDLNWPLDIDLDPLMDRLSETFASCFRLAFNGTFNVSKLLEDAAPRAVNCGRAYSFLRHISRASGRPIYREPRPFIYWREENEDAGNRSPAVQQLSNVVAILTSARLGLDVVSDNNRWGLYVYPTLHAGQFSSVRTALDYFLRQFEERQISNLDQTTFSDYLCCVVHLLSPVDAGLMVKVDKRGFKIMLLIQLFEALTRNTARIDTDLTARVISTTAKLFTLKGGLLHSMRDIERLMTTVSQFCAALPPGNIPTSVFAATLASIENTTDLALTSYNPLKLQNVNWIFCALEYVQQRWRDNLDSPEGPVVWDETTAASITSLLQFLACSDPDSLPDRPSTEVMHIILTALFTRSESACAAFLVLYRAQRWVLNPDANPILRTSWAMLRPVVLSHPNLAACYLDMGNNIANTPEWKPVFYADFATWHSAFTTSTRRLAFRLVDPEYAPFSHDETQRMYVSVVRSIWAPEFDAEGKGIDETNDSWIYSMLAFSKAWDAFPFSADKIFDFVLLAHGTVATSLRITYFGPQRDVDSPNGTVPFRPSVQVTRDTQFF
ncbi:hypothetical protein B0H16DRAFT_1881547 [Mycena metata]|uniref:DUF6535 domain-containing protein n=1 Tax=Mycena metata TaxID=1033252 RepID=A0AAD7JUC9_9AGAR|nr:hypothetical protein B0H16DRAFT_1881547 [Mycena metata]